MTNIEASEPMFELQGVWRRYAGPPAIEALRGVELEIRAGEYVAIIGANGSGKSTLARHLNGLLLPTAGQVRVGGIATNQAGRLGEVRRLVQMVFQQPDSQIVATTVAEDVAFGPENIGVPPDELGLRVRAALETVGLWEARARPPHQLSGGQKQRVAIAGALAVGPRALVLDEATAMLDPAGRAAVLGVLGQLHRQGTTVVTITHEMEEAAAAGRVVVLHQGQVVMDGEPRAVFGRVDELRRLGLDVPPLADLALRLGLPVCLTIEELLAALGPAPTGIGAARAPAETPNLRVVMFENQRVGTQGSLPETEWVGAQNFPFEAEMVRVEDLHHVYLRGTPMAAKALNGVDLTIRRGAIAGLIGPTGSGKSTLMQHLNGLLRPQAGHVWIAGQDWADPALDARLARRRVGLLFQQSEDQLFERYLGDDVAFGPRQMKLDRAEVRRRVQAAMEAVGLPFEAFKDRLTSSLSGGEQRRAALAGVLALEPEVLAADEPTAGLDPRGRADTLAIFRRINAEGVTLLFGSHRMEDVAALCQQVIALKDGRVAADGPARAVLNRTDLTNESGQGWPLLPLAAARAALQAAGWPASPEALTTAELAGGLAPALAAAWSGSRTRPMNPKRT